LLRGTVEWQARRKKSGRWGGGGGGKSLAERKIKQIKLKGRGRNGGWVKADLN